MTITVTGATGQLGRFVVAALKRQGADVVAAVRDTAKGESLGVPARLADYDRPETLVPAFEGTDRLLFVSGSEAGRRVEQHRAVVEAAVKAGVGHIVYTSITRADTSINPLAPEHRATEELIVASGLPYTFLRNNWYLENYTGNLGTALEHGVILGAAGDGRVAAATREDLAAGAAAVLTGDGHAGRIYETGGDVAFSMADLAATITAQSGTEVAYRDLPEDDYAQALIGFGLPEGFARVLAAADTSIARGSLDVATGDLSRLIGRPTTTLAEAVTAALKQRG
ncbi:SDR family oxidoreductase [Dactylosporangium aurantiacum]|uniref:SDR family oxidoreductase n=1 Tax=Dactylosporangium aurantiacum TaxID=35754 RepID=A0A9Q9IJU4_9ACTN|nr:SDR family oxidoreductase [Dactylosporangium aurantiacum]MDG6110295.1 SDR family oxidoreductase [Dactylosporangium aurantiacum]UWZ54388.1 SDR family oxidoreductase [Dactylosporangium aurantiacum]